MIRALRTSLPDQYFEALEPVFLAAKENLERDGSLVPFGFVGNFSTQQVMPVQIGTESYQAKVGSAKHITRVAVMIAADFVALAIESHSLPVELVHRHAESLEEYGSLAKCPHSILVVSFSIETPVAIWMAQCPILPKGMSKKKKTFKIPTPTDFIGVTEASGVFVGLLPGSRLSEPDEQDESPTLH